MKNDTQNEVYNDETRHGFEDAYDHYKELMRHFYLYYSGKKYADNYHAIQEAEKELKGKYFEFSSDWKSVRSKIHAIQGGVFICLNASVEPPDGKKGKPCSVLEGWIDPRTFGSDSHGAAVAVADNVVKQYRSIGNKPQFKAYPDTVFEDMKKAILSWRRAAKDNNITTRYVFHYNGHGVPEPTAQGEFWVFNRQYTQYIPVSMNDLQTWLGAPSVLVYDCNKAGNLVNSFKAGVQARINAYEMKRHGYEDYKANGSSYVPTNPKTFLDCYQFGACGANEYLPSMPEVPADLFTCCMTTPIEISVKFFLLRHPLVAQYYEGLLDKDLDYANVADYKMKYHKPKDFDTTHFRRTPEKKDQIADLGYIYNSIADTIAYTSIPRDLFQRCFRQDSASCSLFRNFLLAQRIMRYYSCNPISDPALPDCHDHELWDHWDMAIEHFLTSLVQLKELHPQKSLTLALAESPRYIFSNFFDASLDHLKNWIQYGRHTMIPPPQLAMTFQLLLIPKYRARALKLLAFFVDLGPWAVALVLNLGVFPYVNKLLQSPVIQLKPMLTFVWAKLLACDHKNMQYEFFSAHGNTYKYFYYILLPESENLNDTQLRHRNAYFESIDKQEKQQKKLEAKIGRPTLTVYNATDTIKRFDFEAQTNKYLDFVNSQGLTFHHLTIALAVLTLVIQDYSSGRDKLVDRSLYSRVINLMERAKGVDTSLQLWGALFLAESWKNSPYAKQLCLDMGLLPKLIKISRDDTSISDLRAAAVNCYTNFLTLEGKMTEELQSAEKKLAEEVLSNLYDASFAVRKESVIFMSAFVTKYIALFRVAAFASLQEEVVIREAHGDLFDFRKKNSTYGTIYGAMWTALCILSSDPHDEVQFLADGVLSAVMSSLKESSDFKEPFDFVCQYLMKKKALRISVPTSSSSSSTSLEPPSLPHPLPPRFNPQVTPALPYKSDLLSFCAEYFKFPQLISWPEGHPLIDEHDVKFGQWRRSRNDSAIAAAQRDKRVSLEGDWSRLRRKLPTRFTPRVIEFTQFDELLVAADQDAVSVWHYARGEKLNQFSNKNPSGRKISQLQFMNEDDSPLLIVGCNDGTLKLYKHFEDLDKCRMVSAWQTLSSVTGDGRSFLFEWQQARGDLIATGNVKVFNIWNAYKERFIRAIPKRASELVTSLTCDQLEGSVFAAGYSDGTIRLYDKRCKQRQEMVKEWTSKVKTSICNIHMQRGGYRELVSASTNGVVQLWDIRLQEPVEKFYTGSIVRTMRVHEHAPVIFTGSDSIKGWTTKGLDICEFYNESRLGGLRGLHRNGVLGMALHPHKMVLAASSGDSGCVNVYSAGGNDGFQ